MKKIHLVNTAVAIAGIAVAYRTGFKNGSANMYVKQMKNVQKAVAGSCEYKMPVEDRSLSCEDMARMGAYRELLKLEKKMRKEQVWR